MLALPPDVVRWVSRSGEDPDCAIAAIMLATWATYDAVQAETMMVDPRAVKRGMKWKDIRAVLKRLGFSSKLKRKYDIDEDTGILDCYRGSDQHVVYLWAGRIIEPRQDRRSLWLDPEEFLAYDNWTAGQLLTVTKD